MSTDEKNTPEQVPGPVRSEDSRYKADGPMGPIGSDLGGLSEDEDLSRRAQDIGLTEASQPGQGPTDDDLTPETLIKEDGARHPFEQGDGRAADSQLEVVDADQIGAGAGLDEAEEGRVHPLDGEPWDDPEDPLRPLSGVEDEDAEARPDRDGINDRQGDINR